MNKPNLYLIYVLLFGVFFSFGCKKENAKIKDQKELEQLYSKIKTIAESSTCGGTTDYELKFTPIGNKACGGPVGYIAYSTSINVNEFKSLVTKYTELEKTYNKKWNIVSTCDIPREPTTVSCSNGKPVLVYNSSF